MNTPYKQLWAKDAFQKKPNELYDAIKTSNAFKRHVTTFEGAKIALHFARHFPNTFHSVTRENNLEADTTKVLVRFRNGREVAITYFGFNFYRSLHTITLADQVAADGQLLTMCIMVHDLTDIP